MSLSLDYQNPYKKPGRPHSLPYVIQLGAGPTNCTIEVLHFMGAQPLTPVNEISFKMMDDIKELLKYVYQTNNLVTFAGQTTGNGGNETMVTNLADPGETIVVAQAGVWGAKVVDMGKRYNLNVVELKSKDGEVFSFDELEDAIVKNKAVALFVTHGESSGGTLQPLEGLGDICHKHNCLLAVDAVVSIGVAPIFVDRWGIDAINGGSQKGVGAPAGMCLLSFSPKAYEKILSKKHPPPYIYDVKALTDVWECIKKGRAYVYTYSSNMLAAIRQALIQICEEGLENVWQRHKKCNGLLVKRAETELGFVHFVKKPENRFYGVACLELPDNINWKVLLKYILDKHQAELSFGIGPTFNKAIRVGLLGRNATPETAEYVIEILKDGLEYCRNNSQLDISHNFSTPNA